MINVHLNICEFFRLEDRARGDNVLHKRIGSRL